jgi:glycosyltransferase involved in cell wall biosynthesis
MTNARRVLVLGFGDIQGSRGARVYLGGLVDGLRAAGDDVRAVFLQQEIPGSAERRGDAGTFEVVEPPLRDGARRVPVALWRMYELAWGNWRGWRVARGEARGAEACAVVGAGLLPLAPLLRALYRARLYVHHGIAEEFLLTGKRSDRLKFALNKSFERWFLPRFDAVVVVSERMAEYCRREYGVRRTVVVPCGVDLSRFPDRAQEREALRREAGLSDRFVFAYSGGAAAWQCVDETVRFYRLARSRVPGAFLLVLSPDGDAWRRALAGLDPTTYRIASVPHAEVGRRLAAADAAFLLRRQTVINEVSAPVKFAEYLACGVPVITSPHVGDYSSVVRERRVGVVMEPEDETTWPAACDDIVAVARDAGARARCRAVAETYAWSNLVPRLRAALPVEHAAPTASASASPESPGRM